MINKLKSNFDEMVVYKDLKKSNFFSALSLPSFLRDWLLKKFADDNGDFNFDELNDYVKNHLPGTEDWKEIKFRIVEQNERVKLLAKISADIDIKTGNISFALPDYSLSSKDTVIDRNVWNEIGHQLVGANETWGLVELGYRLADPYDKIQQGKIKLTYFKSFCPYTVDLENYKNARNDFTTNEWLDVLLGAVDYNAAGYQETEQKLTMLTRLLPFVEKRLNIIELAPKGTGKSYLFGRVSRFGWLSSGGVMSRAKLFYDMKSEMEGLIANFDFITLDEVQTIRFTDTDEMRAALKGYLESGIFTIGKYEGKSDASFILCGNIKHETMLDDGYSNMFEELPTVFHESALIDRFHGFIKGWNIPRMNDDLKISGWALNSEYFSSIMHELRSDISYRAIVDELIIVPEKADTRDTEAVKRITTAYLKLLFPNVKKASDISIDDFQTYCLSRAIKMRDTIKYQLGILDKEYRGKEMPVFKVTEKYE